jgi:formylglycine-generating enzyme required for sulfatase activity
MRCTQGLIGLAVVLLAAGAARAETHAPWPADWNNWNDPALWVTVGNPGNVGELSGAGAGVGGWGPDRVCGAVDYTYKISNFEITAGQYTTFLNAVARADTYGLYNTNMMQSQGCQIQQVGSPGNYSYTVSLELANRPVNYVGWGDAARFANWLNNGQPTDNQNLNTTENGLYYLNGATTDAQLLAVTRKPGRGYAIPTEDEWYKAAYYDPSKLGGAGYYDYPMRSDNVPSNEVVDPDPGNNARFGATGASSPYYRTPVGEFENSEGPWGTFDQGGNVWEWTEALPYPNVRGVRGGSAVIGVEQMHAGLRSYDFPTHEDVGGIRIVEVPEPATMALLALGGIGMLMRRRVAARTDRP